MCWELGDGESVVAQRVVEMLMEVSRPSLIPSLCTHCTRAGIEWRR